MAPAFRWFGRHSAALAIFAPRAAKRTAGSLIDRDTGLDDAHCLVANQIAGGRPHIANVQEVVPNACFLIAIGVFLATGRLRTPGIGAHYVALFPPSADLVGYPEA
jgi:hypothetical protein